MKTQRAKIVSIDPGYKAIGYAAFEGQMLTDYGARMIQAGGFAEALSRVEEMTERLIAEKKPHTLVYEKNQFSQILLNARVVRVCARIEAVCRRRRVPVQAINARTIRKRVCGNGNATKVDVARRVAARYRETRVFLKGRNRTQERFFQNAFDAIACGVALIGISDRALPSRRWRLNLGGKR